MTAGLALAFCKSIANLRAAGVIFHGSRIGLRVRQHLPIGGDYGDADIASRHFRNPVTQSSAVRGGERSRSERGSWRRIGKRDMRDGGELIETGTIVIAAQRALGIEIDGEQDRDQQGEKGK